MWKGKVVHTQLASEGGAPMVVMSELTAITGKGIEGDRYFKGIGFFSHNKGPHRQVTLFESEVLETLKRDHNKVLMPTECRMNLITKGVPLSHLVGQTFLAGEVTLRGVKLNEPCQHLEDVVDESIILCLVHRCGLFAEVLEGGKIRPGDTVQSAEATG